jgi:hypothetical protein
MNVDFAVTADLRSTGCGVFGAVAPAYRGENALMLRGAVLEV